MTKKSDTPREARVSATKASRSFSKLLDQVETGRRFLIHRHGRDVGLIAPPPTKGRLASECLAILRERTPVLLDDRFARDLLDVVAGEIADDRRTWGS